MNILHILNGDSTANNFDDTGLEGDVMVWREVFSQGPLEADVTSGSFWRNRLQWITGTFEDAPENYQENVLDQLTILDEPYDEINLWFEFDLHCQANLLGLMTYLEKKTDLSSPSVFLICPADFPEKDSFSGMGELNGEQLEYLYDNIRVQLSGFDFMLAAEAWEVYVSEDAGKLENYLSKTDFWGSLHLLKPALEAQLNRLHINAAGLNGVEQKLVTIYNSGLKTKPEIYKAFWATEKIYGMGDLEIDIYLRRLENKSLIKL